MMKLDIPQINDISDRPILKYLFPDFLWLQKHIYPPVYWEHSEN